VAATKTALIKQFAPGLNNSSGIFHTGAVLAPLPGHSVLHHQVLQLSRPMPRDQPASLNPNAPYRIVGVSGSDVNRSGCGSGWSTREVKTDISRWIKLTLWFPLTSKGFQVGTAWKLKFRQILTANLAGETSRLWPSALGKTTHCSVRWNNETHCTWRSKLRIHQQKK